MGLDSAWAQAERAGCTAMEQVTEARAAWREALGLYRTQGRTTDAERVERHLVTLVPTR